MPGFVSRYVHVHKEDWSRSQVRRRRELEASFIEALLFLIHNNTQKVGKSGTVLLLIVNINEEIKWEGIGTKLLFM